MKIGTDFSGIGSPEMALKLLGIDHEQVFACEIDKYARKSHRAIYGEDYKLYEDITKRDHSEVEQLDLYVAGFPCQAFSMAGKRKGFEDTRGTLFFNVAEFIKINQPKCFILENVKGLLSHDGGKTFQTIISLLTDNGGTANGQMFIPYFEDGLGYHVYYKVLNTKDFGIPQNRERIFIVGFKEFREFRFPKPFPLELRLKDMLQDNLDDKYFLSDKMIKNFINRPLAKNYPFFPLNINSKYSPCLTARYYKMAATDPYLKVPSATKKGYEEAGDGDSINFSVPNSKIRRGRVGKGVAQTLDTACNQAIVNTYRIRRLTPLECWRLQGYPDAAFMEAQKVNSDTQLYKQAGNSITVNVMMELFKKIYETI
jgi:DNA (cytosine-5)-methyltransferase 1